MKIILIIAAIAIYLYGTYKDQAKKTKEEEDRQRAHAEARRAAQQAEAARAERPAEAQMPREVSLEDILKQLQAGQQQPQPQPRQQQRKQQAAKPAPSLAEQAQMMRAQPTGAQQTKTKVSTKKAKKAMQTNFNAAEEGGRITDDNSPIMNPDVEVGRITIDDARRAVVLDAIFHRPEF